MPNRKTYRRSGPLGGDASGDSSEPELVEPDKKRAKTDTGVPRLPSRGTSAFLHSGTKYAGFFSAKGVHADVLYDLLCDIIHRDLRHLVTIDCHNR